jgi:RNA polymerase sigma-70 factor (ECF subfamily)
VTAGATLEDRAAATVARFEGELRRFIARRVPGPDADDVLQDALLRVHLGVGALRSAEHLAAWVYRVARSAIVDHHRRSRPTGALEEHGPEELPEEPAEDLRALLAACVAPFLEQLPDEQAEALRLTDLGGLTQAEAAARLGVPLPTLKARVQRGRKNLRGEFEACCELVRDSRGAVVEAKPRACGCG